MICTLVARFKVLAAYRTRPGDEPGRHCEHHGILTGHGPALPRQMTRSIARFIFS